MMQYIVVNKYTGEIHTFDTAYEFIKFKDCINYDNYFIYFQKDDKIELQ